MTTDIIQDTGKLIAPHNYASNFTIGGVASEVAVGYQPLYSGGIHQIEYSILDDEDLSGTYYATLSGQPYRTNYVDISDTQKFNVSISALFGQVLEADESNDPFGALFAHVASISFQDDPNGLGTVSVGQAASNAFTPAGTGAVTLDWTDPPDPIDYEHELHGDIWVNVEHSSTDYSGINRWLNDSQDTQGNPIAIQRGTWSYKVALEEISHSLGVDLYQNLGETSSYFLNSHKYTVTSYVPHDDMYYSSVDGTGPYPTGLQMFDILALQEIYDRNYGTRGGSNTGVDAYKMGQGLGASAATPFVYSIWDGGGIDEIDASGFTDAVQIDLRQGRFSSIGQNNDPNGDPRVIWDTPAYDAGNVGISYYTVIENAKGTNVTTSDPNYVLRDGDVLIGNAWDNTLYGEDGNDILYGDGVEYDGDAGFHEEDPQRAWGAGNPKYADNLSGNDTLYGGAGDDWLFGGLGDDSLHGGIGFDQSAYRAFSAAYTDTDITSLVITKVNPASGDYSVQINYADSTVELDSYTDMERIAHAEQIGNTYLTNVQSNPSISARSGGYVSIWQSQGQSGKTTAIIKQDFDLSGNKVGTEDLVMSGGGPNQISPESYKTGSGGYVVAFQGRNGAGKVKTFAKAFDSAGDSAGLDIEVFEDPDTGNPSIDNAYKTAEFAKDVTVLNSGNILVVAQASGNFTQSGQFDIIGKILNSSGNPIGQKFIVNSGAQAGWQTEPSAAALSNGNAVISWTGPDSWHDGVYFIIIDDTGVAVNTATQVNDAYAYKQNDSDVAALADGGFVITWTDQGGEDGSGYGVYYKLYDNSGTELVTYDREENVVYGEVLVNQQTTGTQWQSEVTALDDGGFIITFTDNQASSDGNAASVWAQQYDRYGMAIQDNFLVNITTSGTQQDTAVAGLNTGDFAISWEDQTSDIFGRLYSNSAPIPAAPPGSSSAMSSGGGGSSSLLAAEPAAEQPQVAFNQLENFQWGGVSSAPAQSQNFGGGFFSSWSPVHMQTVAISPAPQIMKQPEPQDIPLYQEPDFFIRGNGVADRISVTRADYSDEYVEIFQSFKAEEGDILDLSDLFRPLDSVSEAAADFIAFSEADGDTLVLVDQDGTRGEHSFQTVAYLQDTLGLHAQELVENGNIVV